MRCAVIGVGVGQVHARVLAAREDVELVGVCDLNAEPVRDLAAAVGTQAFTDWLQMLDEARPEAVSLCTNPANHLPMGQEMAARGIHVLCEKPMAPDVAQCLALTEACATAGVTLMVAQKKRFCPAFSFLKEHLAGDFGRPLSLNYRYHLGQVPRDWFWQEDDGGGPLLENSIHCFDSLRFLVGEIRTIRALGGNLLNPDRAPQLDVALALLEFNSGCVGAVELGTASEWVMADEELFVACEHAVARVRGRFDRPSVVDYVYRGQAEPQNLTVDYEGDHATREFVAEIDEFLTCCRTGRTPFVTGADAAQSVACCLALKQAVRTGETVTVPSPV
jgi:predicted dehydrogenase